MNNFLKTHYKSLFLQDKEFITPCVMWFWNDTIYEEELEYQIDAFREQGIKDVYVHPLWGLQTDYLSDEYFRLIRHTVMLLKAKGMRFFIYDDYSWPSGFAGGKLIQEDERAISRLLKVDKVSLVAGQPLRKRYLGHFEAAQAVFSNRTPVARDITDEVTVSQDGECFEIECRLNACVSCDVYVSYTVKTEGITAAGYWSSSSDFTCGYTDTMSPAVTDAYIRSTHERYRQAVGDEFGKTVVGVFNDESNIMSMFDFAPDTYPFTPLLYAEFSKDHGYDLKENLFLLSESAVSDDYAKLRYHLWTTLTRLFSDNYFGRLSEWCAQNRLLLTGHLSGEANIQWHTFQSGEFYTSLSKFDMPGIDHILSKGYLHDKTMSFSAKLAATTAKIDGKPHVFCEAFSGSGWDLTLCDAKRVINRLISHGINYFMYMGAHYSLDGGRKHMPLCYPPSHGYNNPVFSHYSDLNRYTENLCALSADTVPAGRIALVIPQVHHYIHPMDYANIDRSWLSIAGALVQGNIEFDVFFEPLSPQTSVENRQLRLQACAYDLLIVPAMEFTDSATADMIDRFVSGGGRVLFDGNAALTCADTMRAYHFDGPHTAVFHSGELSVLELCGMVRWKAEKQALGFEIVRQSGDCIYGSLRENGASSLLFLNNDNEAEAAVTCRVYRGGNASVVEPEGGVLRGLPARAVEDGIEFDLNIPGYTLIPVMITDRPEADAAAVRAAGPGHPVASAALYDWRIDFADANIFPLRACIDGGAGCAIPAAPNEVPGGIGLKGGEAYAASAEFTLGYIPDPLYLIYEDANTVRLKMNGRPLPKGEKIRLWGPCDYLVNIHDYAVSGQNRITFSSSLPAWGGPHEIPCFYVKGRFALDGDGVTQKPGDGFQPCSFREQGYPYYSGRCTYSAAFHIDHMPGRPVVSLRVEAADICEIYVNGTFVKKLLWPPYEADISAHCQPGENRLELVFTTTNNNLFATEKTTMIDQSRFTYSSDGPLQPSALLSPPVIAVFKG